MSEKHEYIISIDPNQLFDTIQKVGQEAAGNRFTEFMLSLSTGKVDLRTALGVSIYGIEVRLKERAE